MAQTADFEGVQRAPRNVGDRNIHEQPPNILVAEADGWGTRMVTGLRSAPQADIGVVIETRVGARPHMSVGITPTLMTIHTHQTPRGVRSGGGFSPG
jgi:hypothetical protein